ncbi:hypothetical protein ACSSV4_002920 [Roseovarius sp. MBR-154]|jgi:hypothetical protein
MNAGTGRGCRTSLKHCDAAPSTGAAGLTEALCRPQGYSERAFIVHDTRCPDGRPAWRLFRRLTNHTGKFEEI